MLEVSCCTTHKIKSTVDRRSCFYRRTRACRMEMRCIEFCQESGLQQYSFSRLKSLSFALSSPLPYHGLDFVPTLTRHGRRTGSRCVDCPQPSKQRHDRPYRHGCWFFCIQDSRGAINANTELFMKDSSKTLVFIMPFDQYCGAVVPCYESDVFGHIFRSSCGICAWRIWQGRV